MVASYLVAGALIGAGALSSRLYRGADRRAAESERPTHGTLRWFGPAVPFLRLAAVLPAIVATFAPSTSLLLRTHGPVSPVVATLGLAMIVGGAALFWSAMRTLGEHYSPCFDKRVPDGLVMSGPYRVVRHPVYTSNLLIIFGAWIAVGSGWMLASGVVTAIGYALSQQEEESVLVERYPEYAGYRSVTGAILPRIVRGR